MKRLPVAAAYLLLSSFAWSMSVSGAELLDSPVAEAAATDATMPADMPASLGDVPFTEMADQVVAAPRRWYVSGIIGPSFATLTDDFYADVTGGSVEDTILSGGGAVGLAVARPAGALRFEVEGRARGTLSGESAVPELDGQLDWSAGNGWSTMANVWRDLMLNDRFGVYLGGGIGAGGYTYSASGSLSDGFLTDTFSGTSQVSSFAWQVGGGGVWAITDRITFDVGYRFYSLQPSDTTIFVSDGVTTDSLGSSQHGFSASELMFSLRIYDPFQRWDPFRRWSR
jgi:opacity protein-like surface antigen